MHTEDQLIALSALQHWLYCPRQCALIHLEQAWSENRFTAEGKVMHERAHDGPDESRSGVRITRGMPVRSLVLGISGQCHIVEFSKPRSTGSLPAVSSSVASAKGEASRVGRVSPVSPALTALPVEYKRGKPKSHRADEVQLCAQGMCLEEMLGIEIHSGALFYGKRKRRTEIAFDAELRDLVKSTVPRRPYRSDTFQPATAHRE